MSATDVKITGMQRVPRWVLHAIESKIADCEFALRERSRMVNRVSPYFLRETAKQLAWARDLIREHGKIRTEFWYDLPPHTRKKANTATGRRSCGSLT